MKTLVKIFFLVAAISLVAGCNNSDVIVTDDTVALKSGQPHTVTVPFEANLLGEITNLVEDDPDCPGYLYFVTVGAAGNATHMGNVSIILDFCTVGPPDPDIEEEHYTFGGGDFELVAANGDKLFLHSEGGYAIIGRTDDHPDNVTDYWRIPYNIYGGTGRFEEAEGVLQSDDYSTDDGYTHHHWTGEITLLKGKR